MSVAVMLATLTDDRIDLYAFSYGTVTEQAYAARFPHHIHALVMDAGFPPSDPADPST
jgi:pimeloyl-ACP methyl ester carboxylesterase